VLPGPETLRFVYQTPISVYQTGSATLPALVAAIRAESGDLVAIEITYLTPNGNRAEHLRVPRKTVGSPECPYAVRLDPVGPDLCVGEGLFTQLSARDHFGWPTWALLSTSNLRHWRPPPGVRRLLIAGDRGKDGERSARKLYSHAIELGLAASLRFPPASHNDFNQAMNAALPQ
jgi:putative DNA primase/helicase